MSLSPPKERADIQHFFLPLQLCVAEAKTKVSILQRMGPSSIYPHTYIPLSTQTQEEGPNGLHFNLFIGQRLHKVRSKLSPEIITTPPNTILKKTRVSLQEEVTVYESSSYRSD
jgi:hypothetical protein